MDQVHSINAKVVNYRAQIRTWVKPLETSSYVSAIAKSVNFEELEEEDEQEEEEKNSQTLLPTADSESKKEPPIVKYRSFIRKIDTRSPNQWLSTVSSVIDQLE